MNRQQQQIHATFKYIRPDDIDNSFYQLYIKRYIISLLAFHLNPVPLFFADNGVPIVSFILINFLTIFI